MYLSTQVGGHISRLIRFIPGNIRKSAHVCLMIFFSALVAPSKVFCLQSPDSVRD